MNSNIERVLTEKLDLRTHLSFFEFMLIVNHVNFERLIVEHRLQMIRIVAAIPIIQSVSRRARGKFARVHL